MRELAGDGVPVTVTSGVLTLARQPYYRWLDRPLTGGCRVRSGCLREYQGSTPTGRYVADDPRLAKPAIVPIIDGVRTRLRLAAEPWRTKQAAPQTPDAESAVVCCPDDRGALR